MNHKAAPTIHDLYPDFDEQELVKAEDNLDRYLALVLRIFERVESEMDPQAHRLTGRTGTLEFNSPQARG